VKILVRALWSAVECPGWESGRVELVTVGTRCCGPWFTYLLERNSCGCLVTILYVIVYGRRGRFGYR
jgi:hypothetical protein